MRHLPHLALAACLALTASGEAGRRKSQASTKAKAKHTKVAPPIDHDDVDVEDDEAEADDAPTTARAKRSRLEGAKAARARARARKSMGEEDESNARPVAFDVDRSASSDDEAESIGRDDGESDEVDDAPVKLRKYAAPRKQDWNVAFGPYLWASAVDADVSLGPAGVSAGVDFMKMTRHAKYGIELLAEVRYRKLSFNLDFLFGVVGVAGAAEVGPLMATLDGEASSLLIDGTGGYQLLGNDESMFSVEARAGVRYQRTAVTATIGFAGNTLNPLESVSAGGDAIVGARVWFKPFRRFYASGGADTGVYGVSSSTWSVSADATARVSQRMLVSLGYRTLTMERGYLALTMYGPRVAFQLLF